MSKPIGLSIFFVSLIAIAAVVHAAATKQSSATQSSGEQNVVIDNFTFSPAELTVAVGTKVTWVNHDDVPHTATSSDKTKMFNSGTLDTDAKFSFVFEKAGTFPYFCAVHPHMTGRIIVK